MIIMDDKDLIISLIQDNLISLKLIYGLEELGLLPDDYYLRLGDTIFKLMGIESGPQSDVIFEEVFMANSKKICDIDIRDPEGGLKELSEEIYKDLLFAKRISKTE